MGILSLFRRPPPAPKRPRVKGHRVDFDYVKADEIRTLLNNIGSVRDRAILAAFAYLGVRCNELRMLNVGDIDWEDRAVKVLRAKGGKQRVVPMTDSLAAILRGYLTERLPVTDADGEALFTTRTHTRISNRHIRNLVKRHGHAAGVAGRIPQGLHPHALRHSFGTALHKEGVDLGTIQIVMGHSSPATTMLYAHIDPETKRAAVERLHFGD